MQRCRWQRKYEYNDYGRAAAATHAVVERQLNLHCVQRFQYIVMVKH